MYSDNNCHMSKFPEIAFRGVNFEVPLGFGSTGNQKMYGGEFDGSAAFSGGGFMPSQATTQGPDSFSSYKNRDVRTLLPLTLKQLNSISTNGESNFFIDGVEINTVAIVGRVCSMENRITQVDFVIDDGTGRVECVRWVHERQDTDEIEAVSLGMYVRVHGHLKSFQGKRSLNIFSIRPVTDFNEVVHHFIECMYVHMYNSKLRGGNTPKSQMPYSTTPSSAKGYQAGPSNQFAGQHNDAMHGIRQMVLNYLNQPAHLASEAGVHCDIIARDLRVSLQNVRDALDQLSNDGCVYSTMDESCFKSTANA
ncbi:PREDICTED: replication protein A 32 kDa subunit B [Tarenaya hassleriana]|uniref:replication protein A 32 kDa subunit B n=1 Tax=Tarenaya hassleriana TaxID=28532 RepID=UPI00053C1420|nr:PREDICTED: replication protein A 32 kDa subunit B [Tarenaya hassleriana]XP_010525056.1 PREDICTED: replication protein A 32 kDa subunit B [Tarenaya hassleriana]